MKPQAYALIQFFFDLDFVDGVLLRLREDVPLEVLVPSVSFVVAAEVLALGLLLVLPLLEDERPRKRPIIAKTGTTKNSGSDGIDFGLPIAS